MRVYVKLKIQGMYLKVEIFLLFTSLQYMWNIMHVNYNSRRFPPIKCIQLEIRQKEELLNNLIMYAKRLI